MTPTAAATTSRADDTRARLLDAGEQLFAARGVDGVSVAEITRAAGQRNGAAIHYHFGGRDGLLHAILDRHLVALDTQRAALLADLRARDAVTVEALVRIIVEPLAGCLATDSGRAFLRIQAHRSLAAGGILDQRGVMADLRRALDAAVPPAPRTVKTERGRLAGLMVNQRLGRRAEEEAAGVRRPSRAVVVDTLIAAATAVLESQPGVPVSRTTKAVRSP